MEVKNFMLQVIVMLCITVDILMSKSKVLNNIPAISHESSRIVLSHWSVTNQRSKIKGTNYYPCYFIWNFQNSVISLVCHKSKVKDQRYGTNYYPCNFIWKFQNSVISLISHAFLWIEFLLHIFSQIFNFGFEWLHTKYRCVVNFLNFGV
jgi:hypothetical protein